MVHEKWFTTNGSLTLTLTLALTLTPNPKPNPTPNPNPKHLSWAICREPFVNECFAGERFVVNFYVVIPIYNVYTMWVKLFITRILIHHNS